MLIKSKASLPCSIPAVRRFYPFFRISSLFIVSFSRPIESFHGLPASLCLYRSVWPRPCRRAVWAGSYHEERKIGSDESMLRIESSETPILSTKERSFPLKSIRRFWEISVAVRQSFLLRNINTRKNFYTSYSNSSCKKFKRNFCKSLIYCRAFILSVVNRQYNFKLK